MAGRGELEDAVGRRVRALREARELSQTELAKLANTSRSHVTAIERGEKSPTLATLGSLARALGTSLASLVSDEDDPGLPVRDEGVGADRLMRSLRARGPAYLAAFERMLKVLDRFARDEGRGRTRPPRSQRRKSRGR